MTNSDNEKPGELMPCPFCPKGETHIRENHHSPTMSGGIKEPISVDIIHWCEGSGLPHRRVNVTGRDRQQAVTAYNTRAPQSPPVQGDEVREAVDFFTKGKGQTYACNYTKTLIRAAEQRVAGQAGVPEWLPIESAPRDQVILLTDGKTRWFDKVPSEFVDVDQWISRLGAEGIPKKATHWMDTGTLPTPPKASAQAERGR